MTFLTAINALRELPAAVVRALGALDRLDKLTDAVEELTLLRRLGDAHFTPSGTPEHVAAARLDAAIDGLAEWRIRHAVPGLGGAPLAWLGGAPLASALANSVTEELPAAPAAAAPPAAPPPAAGKRRPKRAKK